MYFKDNTNYSYYLTSPIDKVKNVGWLEKGQSFPTGKVDIEVQLKLASIITATGNVDIHVNKMRSLDSCSVSGCEGIKVCHNSSTIDLGGSEIWIPSINNDEYFACPSLIYHYIEKHNYLPPKKFIESVIEFDLNMDYIGQNTYLELVNGHF